MIIRVLLPRFAHLIVLFLLIAVLGFLLLHAAPGNPALLLAGIEATEEQIATITRQLGLDQPLHIQLIAWVGGLLTGELGTSYTGRQSVASILANGAAPTIQLALLAFALTIIFGVLLGVRSALRPEGIFDKITRAYTIVSTAIPDFVLGLLFVLIFGWWVTHTVIPYQGYVSMVSDPWQGFLHTILPALCLSSGPIGTVARHTRSSMLEVLNQDYVTAARSLGIREREIIWKDALKNALMPVLTVLGVLIGRLLSGTVVVEVVFGIPGLGRQLVISFTNRDYPTAIGVMLVFAIGFLVINFLTDMAYALINPRVRRSMAARS